jgi:hypothetical protein
MAHLLGFGSGAKPGYAVGMRKDVVDADFEVISGPSPVAWAPPRRRKAPVHEWIVAGFFALLALYVAVLGLAGVDLDTRDAVKASQARQPAAAAIASPD